MSATILKLDRDWKLLNSDVIWTQQFYQKSVEPIQKHVNKCEQRIIPEYNAVILVKWHITISVWAEGTIEEEDCSDCFEESGIIEETSRRTRNTDCSVWTL